LDRLDEPTGALMALAAAIATGDEPSIEREVQRCSRTGVPPLWVDELILQTVLICGWPRALVAARVWREGGGTPRGPAPGAEDGSDYARHREWMARGEQVCRQVYGDTYAALRRNIRHLHPDLESSMIVEGYGRVLGRPGLDLARRELCSVAQIAVLGARRQLRSHLKGALNAGATPEVIGRTLELVRQQLSPGEWTAVRELWERVVVGGGGGSELH